MVSCAPSSRVRTLRAWHYDAMRRLSADTRRSADTHLFPLPIPSLPKIVIYLKDESTHLTGSLKHRLARSLFMYAIVNGEIGEGTTVIE
ncbi:PLP-dependent cysteine synthase family protein, partial [bacterium]